MSNFGSYSDAKNVVKNVFSQLLTDEMTEYNRQGPEVRESIAQEHDNRCMELISIEKKLLNALDACEAHEMKMFEEHYSKHNNPEVGLDEDYEEVH